MTSGVSSGPPGDAAFRRESLMGTEIEPNYAGALSFMRRRYTRDLAGVDIAVTGIPFDLAVSNRPGARLGPQAIRAASVQHAWGPAWPWRFDPFDRLAVIDYGDCWFDYGDPLSAPAAVEAHAAAILAGGAELLALGGDHSISYPLLKAHAARHGPLALVHFDAHRDMEPDSAARLDHGTMFARAAREGIINTGATVQIGIRTCYHGEEALGVTIIDAEEAHNSDADMLARRIVETVGEHPAYLSFDIDFLDPSYAPGTGTPVPGGFSTYQALAILRRLTDINFVGADLVEVSPPFDHAGITANAAAMIALEYLCLRAA